MSATTSPADTRQISLELPTRDSAGFGVLDLGCGPYKIKGAIGVDCCPWPDVDVVHDLDSHPWPFSDDAFDRVVCRHVLAHLANVVRAMEELHRIVRPGGLVEIVTPHFSSDNAFTDITSRRLFGYRSMDYFCDNRRSKYRYGHATFQLLEARISFRQAAVFEPDERKPNPLRAIGVESLINRFPRFYEHFLAFVLRANELYFRLRVLKQSGGQALA
jgi:SAM-dependent methyltransferase